MSEEKFIHYDKNATASFKPMIEVRVEALEKALRNILNEDPFVYIRMLDIYECRYCAEIPRERGEVDTTEHKTDCAYENGRVLLDE